MTMSEFPAGLSAVMIVRDAERHLAILERWVAAEPGHIFANFKLGGQLFDLGRTAEALGQDESALGLRLERAGFGYLLRQDVLDHYRAQARR